MPRLGFESLQAGADRAVVEFTPGEMVMPMYRIWKVVVLRSARATQHGQKEEETITL